MASLPEITVKPPRRGPGRPTLSNEELLDKALDVFLEQGFDRTSIDAICAAAGVAKRTVYQRHGDKKSLFRAALERAIDEWIVPIAELRALESADLELCLLRIGRRLVANLMTPAGIRLLQITNAESHHQPEIGAYAYTEGTGRTIDYLTDLFERRVGPLARAETDWREAAFAFLTLVTGPGTMAAWGVVLDPAAVDDHVSFTVRLFLHGLLDSDQAGSLQRRAAGID
ncbi:MAG: TetR/AcrR family transcriptional regulator [Novosphingobium sp.]|nr:TetR/AcrR family transcriptional regulator [Novosphingobium sp.]